MVTLRGLSYRREVLRLLEVERRGPEVYLHIHRPGTEAQEILVPRPELLEAIRQGGGELAGFSPARRTPKECLIESRPEGLRLRIHSESRKGAWSILVRQTELNAALI